WIFYMRSAGDITWPMFSEPTGSLAWPEGFTVGLVKGISSGGLAMCSGIWDLGKAGCNAARWADDAVNDCIDSKLGWVYSKVFGNGEVSMFSDTELKIYHGTSTFLAVVKQVVTDLEVNGSETFVRLLQGDYTPLIKYGENIVTVFKST